jgi:hypothetical protein
MLLAHTAYTGLTTITLQIIQGHTPLLAYVTQTTDMAALPLVLEHRTQYMTTFMKKTRLHFTNSTQCQRALVNLLGWAADMEDSFAKLHRTK